MKEHFMTHERLRDHRIGLVAVLCLAANLVVWPAFGADHAGRLTAVIGEASLADRPIEPRSNVTEGASIVTGEDGNLAMLVDEDAVVELCAKTEMKLLRDEDTGTRIIEVGAGTTRIIVDPNTDIGKIQIVTPAMVATLMGTAIYVTVDPVTKESTLISEDHRVKFQSGDPNVAGSTIINGMQKLTMRPGEPPPENPEDVDEDDLMKVSECFKDTHGAAVASDRSESEDDTLNRMAAVDGKIPLPPWRPGPPDPQGPDPGDPDIESPNVHLPEIGDDLAGSACDPPSDACLGFPNPDLGDL
jgi:hypothetical protein